MNPSHKTSVSFFSLCFALLLSATNANAQGWNVVKAPYPFEQFARTCVLEAKHSAGKLEVIVPVEKMHNPLVRIVSYADIGQDHQRSFLDHRDIIWLKTFERGHNVFYADIKTIPALLEEFKKDKNFYFHHSKNYRKVNFSLIGFTNAFQKLLRECKSANRQLEFWLPLYKELTRTKNAKFTSADMFSEAEDSLSKAAHAFFLANIKLAAKRQFLGIELQAVEMRRNEKEIKRLYTELDEFGLYVDEMQAASKKARAISDEISDLDNKLEELKQMRDGLESRLGVFREEMRKIQKQYYLGAKQDADDLRASYSPEKLRNILPILSKEMNTVRAQKSTLLTKFEIEQKRFSNKYLYHRFSGYLAEQTKAKIRDLREENARLSKEQNEASQRMKPEAEIAGKAAAHLRKQLRNLSTIFDSQR